MPWVSTLSIERREEAVRLYESGLSAQQVADSLGVSLNATFYALRKEKVVRRSQQEASKARYATKPLSYSIKEKLSDEEERLKISAVMLYWAEGYKVGKQCTIDFANSDPEMARIFRSFLSRICGVNENKLRASLYCYEGQDMAKLRKFWSNYISIPESQFTKAYVKAGNPGLRGPRMTNGLVHIRYCDKKLLQQILAWIDEYCAEMRRWQSGQLQETVNLSP